MARRDGNAVIFDGWEGGEYGILDPGVAGSRSKQMYTALNMIRYRSGLLGPRPGLKGISISGLPSSTPLQQMDPIASGDSGLGSGPYFCFMAGGEMYQVSLDSSPNCGSAYTGTNPTTFVRPIPYGGQFGSGSLILNYKDKLYSADHTSQAWNTAPGTPPEGTTIGYWGLRFYANDSDASNGDSRLYYSDPFPGWGTWDSESYYDIGSAYPITTLRPFRDGLLIGKASGEVYKLSGTPGTNAYVDNLTNGGAAAFEPRGLVTDADVYWYMGQNKPWPSSFNGAVHQHYDWIRFINASSTTDDGTEPAYRFVEMPWIGTNDFLLLAAENGYENDGNNGALSFTKGAFSRLEWDDIDIAAWGVPLADQGATGTPNGLPQRCVLVDDTGNSPAFYWYVGLLDRPGFSSDDYANVGDDSTTEFDAYVETPEYFDPQGGEMRVRKVIVDWVAWNTGGANNARIDAQVRTVARRGAGDATDPDGIDYTASTTILNETLSSLSTAGTQGRSELQPESEFGGGFRVKLSNLRSVAIKRIIAVLEYGSGRRM